MPGARRLPNDQSVYFYAPAPPCYLIPRGFWVNLRLHLKGGGRMTSSDCSNCSGSQRPGEVAET
jgi:hypothetical protein